ncbi:peptidase M24 [Erysipelatoclostridium sp. An15]|uniref:aminopeptidase P family protein n=1 Tax=unclassified Thomasclavelia TaxID=3025756 RepID=UPI000B38616A|nr:MULTISPECIES: aminopeptidase P family protein [unclassified Thomasclavelia]OUP77640.1 peptidase M24 [Erysipelatoclostridium sp. An173]OUQ08020.1 peptidase M24 [Erysipelatoclostridium sp. An15]
MVKERIEELRKLMKEHGIDLYIIPTSDYHQSEYVGEYFGARKYMSGFTGSAGTLIVGLDEARLWVDGRYHIQAEKQTANTGITLMKMGLAGVDTINEYLEKNADKTVGFDGRVMSYQEVLNMKNKVISNVDLVNEIWHDRPSISHEPAFIYDEKYCGESRGSKLQRLRKAMKDCNHHIITSLDDIVWLFNIRGNDVPCNPVVLSYALINQEDAYLYVQDGVIDAKIEAILKRDSIYIKNYNDIYDDVEKLTGKVLLDKQIVNYEICRRLNCEIVNGPNPTQLFKAIKNKTEIEATKYAHIKDGVAVTKFMYWLKTNVGKIPMDEVSISDKLEEFRKAQKDFYDLSFDTICAYKENAALMHYKAEPGKCATVTNEGLLLIDSGGQYFDGTTDITRTFVLGNISDIERRDYTVALKALLRLQDARFIAGTTGPNLDLFAREMVYKYNLDYRCGTGHGVGHFLNVHEGPNGFRPKDRPGSNAMCAFEPGMITTDEPGIYIENSHGVRHENELLCVETANNEYGQFLRFEPITMVPFDLDGLDLNLLSNHEIEQINEYHQLVFDTIAPYLTSEEKSWLQANLLIK